jgi:hypothetical protein
MYVCIYLKGENIYTYVYIYIDIYIYMCISIQRFFTSDYVIKADGVELDYNEGNHIHKYTYIYTFKYM